MKAGLSFCCVHIHQVVNGVFRVFDFLAHKKCFPNSTSGNLDVEEASIILRRINSQYATYTGAF